MKTLIATVIIARWLLVEQPDSGFSSSRDNRRR